MSSSFAKWLRSLSVGLQSLVVLLGLSAFLAVASPSFLEGQNLLNVLQQSAINAILGIGLTFVILSAGIDLSVGSVMALSGVVTADLLIEGYPMGVAMLAGVATGAACGWFNGIVTAWTNIPPFITTLGTMLVARSGAKIYSNSKPISGLPEGFRALSGDVLGVPIFVWAVALLYLVSHRVLKSTRLGRYTYAIGGNEAAAWVAGIPVRPYKAAIYALSGLMAGIAAVLMTARLNSATPMAGDMYELYAIAAAVIGGTSLMGGKGRLSGTLIGALIMGTLRNGLNLLNVPSAWEGLVIGVVLVLAVVLDRFRRSRSSLGQTPSRRGIWRAAVAAGFALSMVAAWNVRASMTTTNWAIGFVPKTLSDPFFVTMYEAAQKQAQASGVELIALAPDRQVDVERQHQILENLVERKVAAIVLAPSGAKEILPAIAKANRAKLPVLVVDSDIDHALAKEQGVTTQTYIGSDNVKGGAIAADYLSEFLGSGEVALIEGVPGHASTDDRKAGFLQRLEKYPGLKLVASQTANSERERGYTVAQNIMQSHPRLRAFFAVTDAMALGALEAVDAAGKLSGQRAPGPAEIVVVGFDGSKDALDNVKSGRLLGSVAQFPAEMGRLGVKTAVELVRDGKAPPSVIHTKVEMIDRRALGLD